MLLLTTTVLQCPSERSNELISLWSKCNALRTIYRPSESISPKDFRFCFVVKAQLPNPLRVLSKTQPRGWSYGLLVIGYGILAIGYERFVIGNWLLAIGDWLLNLGGKAAYPCLYTLHSTLYTKSDSDHALSLIPYRLIPCQRQCFDADATGRCRSDTK